MKYLLKLIRWPNLLLIVLFQYLLRYSLITPILNYQEKGLIISHFDFTLLVISCILIAAGGYIINDIEDLKIDYINKPNKVIVEKHIPLETANNLYMILTFIGVLIGFYLTYFKEIRLIGMINILTAGLLYFYSTSYKCIPLLGNLIISLLVALLTLEVIIAEPAAMADPAVLLFSGGYMIFSFIMTLIRELLKDIEDINGDSACGCETLPVKIGLKLTKIIVFALTSLLIFMLFWVQFKTKQWESLLPFLYVTLFVIIPLVYLSILIIRTKISSDFKQTSILVKMIMFTGILSMLIFYFSS